MSRRKKKKTRFCESCNAIIGGNAVYCEYCGARLDIGPPSDKPTAADGAADRVEATIEQFESQDSRKLSRQLVQGHLNLARRIHREASSLLDEGNAAERQLGVLAGSRVNVARTQAVQEVLEDLELIGDRWEELQHEYNRESEKLDDDFGDRFAELEMDMALPTDLEESVRVEVTRLTDAFALLGDRVRVLGDRGNDLLEGLDGRWFGDAARRRIGVGEVFLWLAAAIAAAAVVHLKGGGVTTAALAGAPAIVGLIIVTVAKSRR